MDMLRFKYFFLQLYEFLAHEFVLFGYHFSLLEVTFLSMTFIMSINIISRLFGKVAEEDNE